MYNTFEYIVKLVS